MNFFCCKCLSFPQLSSEHSAIYVLKNRDYTVDPFKASQIESMDNFQLGFVILSIAS